MQILIVSKLPVIRWGLIHVLQEFERDFDFWEAGTEDEAIHQLKRKNTHLVVIQAELDSGMLMNMLS